MLRSPPDLASVVDPAIRDPATSPPGSHFVQFYETDAGLLARLQAFVLDSLREGGAAVVIATAEHTAALDAALHEAGVDLESMRADCAYITLDAAALLETFIIDGVADAARFEAAVVPALERASAGGRPVRAFGEMVALLVAGGRRETAIQLEDLWNALQQRHSFDLFCAYSLDLLGTEPHEGLVREISETHDEVIPGESFGLLEDSESRRELVADLQQRARRLEAEVKTRRGVEQALARALAAEQEARKVAEGALRLRDEFIAIAAHELNTPLTTVIGNVQLAARWIARQGTPAVPGVDLVLRDAVSSTKKLASLVGQMLDISRSDAGKLPIHPLPGDLVPLVREVVASTETRYGTHPIVVSGPDSAPCTFDALRLELVLSNLIDNAVKFSPTGSPVEVMVRTVEPAEGACVQVMIQDQGYGVSPEQRSLIFERFYQGDSPALRQGLGLGLYVSSQVVEQHGGRLFAEYPESGGSRFIVQLPASVTPGRGRAAK